MNYKVTYISESMTMAFVRMADNAILYTNDFVENVIAFAKATGKKFFVE